MPGHTLLMKGLPGADLCSSVQEENTAQRESYSADWCSISLNTQPQERCRLGRGIAHTQEDLRHFHSPDGICSAKTPVEEITVDLPPIKPIRVDFAKAPRSLGRFMSQQAQRG